MGNSTNHPRHSGQFQKGDDKRRNKQGQRNRAAVAFTRTLRELIVREGERSLSVQGEKHKKVEWMVRQLWSKAIAGEAWAVAMIFERVEGRVKTELELSGSVSVKGYGIISPDDWDDATNGDNPST